MKNKAKSIRESDLHSGTIRVLILAAVMIQVAAACAYSQFNRLNAGDRVMITARAISEEPVIGDLISGTDSTASVLVDGDSVVTVPRPLIQRVAVSGGYRSRAFAGFMYGAASGAFLGYVTETLVVGRDWECLGFICAGKEKKSHDAIWTVAGLIAGAGIGIIGGSSVKSERWKRVPVTFSVTSLPYTDRNTAPRVTVRIPLK